MFSRRLSWTQEVNELSKLLADKRPRLDLTESNPTRAGFEYPSAEILAALANPRAMTYEPSPRGLLSAREAVARLYDVGTERILLTASTSEAYSYLFQLLADPGDEILCPRPSYPLFEFLAGLSNVVIKQYPLRYDGTWHVDFDALQSASTARTRAVVVVHPNNPTGSYLTEGEIAGLETLGLPILSDEVFGPRTLAGERRALTFSMGGLSKTAGLPQMKLGWIVASGPGHEKALNALELIADTYLSVGAPVQVALPRLLELGESVRAQIAERVAANRRHLIEALAGSPAGVLASEGGWYAVVQVPRTRSEEEWCLTLLRDREVLVQPGYFFDFESEAFLVVSLLTESAIFAEGVRRLRSFM